MLLHRIPFFPPLFLHLPKFPHETPCRIECHHHPLHCGIHALFKLTLGSALLGAVLFVLLIIFCTVRIMAFSLPFFKKDPDLFNRLAGRIPLILLVLTRRKQLQIPRHLCNCPTASFQVRCHYESRARREHRSNRTIIPCNSTQRRLGWDWRRRTP